MNTSIHHIASCGLLAMLLLAMPGCQSISGFAPYCQSDDDCQSHQFCDTDENACFVREAYSTSCDPDLLFPDCPAATTCDETAKICMPRTFRAAFIYPFNTSVYGRRQYANLLRFLTESVSKQLFEPLDCKDASEDARKAHVVYTCTGKDIEFLFIDSSGEDNQIAQNVSEAYNYAPFDVALPGRSVEYAHTVPLFKTNQVNVLTLGRSNLDLDYVSQELEQDYQHPPLETRFDFSLKQLDVDRTLWSFVSEELECKKPAVLMPDVGIEQFTQQYRETVWAELGTCLDRIIIEDSTSTAWIDTINAQEVDCIFVRGFIDANHLYSTLATYAQSSRFAKLPTIQWIIYKYFVDESSAISQNLRQLLLNSFQEDTYFKYSETSNNPKYTSFANLLEKDYKNYLEQRNCLNTPQKDCSALNCSAPTSTREEEACLQLNCANPQSCLELGCLTTTPPEWCELIQCEPTQHCDYHEPSQLYTQSNDMSTIINQVILPWLLSYTIKHNSQNLGKPTTRSDVRDTFLELLGHTETTHTCIFPDITSCKLLANEQKKYAYVSIFPLTINGDGRISSGENTTQAYSQVNSSFEFLPPVHSYSPQDIEALNNQPAVEPAPECN